MKKPEIILISLVVISLVMNYFRIPFNGVLSVLSITGLAVYYYPFFPLIATGNSLKTVFSTPKTKGILFFAFLTGLGISTSLVGTLFKIQLWPFGQQLLSVGLFALVALMAINAIQFKKTSEGFFKDLLIRCTVAFFVGSVVFMIPNDALMEHHFGNNPEYIKAFKNWEANPNDPGAMERLEQERMKMYENEDQAND